MAKHRLRLNPATGELDLVVNPESFTTVPRVVDTYICDSGANIGDLVFESLTTDNYVEVAVDNESIAPVIGVIISKPSSTQAEVLFLGKVGGFSGLTKGQNVFVSVSGGLTSTLVSTGYHQVMGYATSATEVFIRPQLMRVKRI